MASTEKIAFITGANRGIGLETARGLAQLGITVLIGSRDAAKGETVAAKLSKETGQKVESIQFDVVNLDDHHRLAAALQKRFGRLDILINNAGVMVDDGDFTSPNGFNTTSTVSQKTLHDTFNINFFSVVALTQTLLPLIKQSPAGRIVNLSSILGSLALHSDPKSPIYGAKAFAYDSSKTALNAFTVHLAAELRGSPIKVNSAHPGWVKTDMGGPSAPMDVIDGAKTSIQLATLPPSGPTGGYFHMGDTLPW